MDEDLVTMAREPLIDEVRELRSGMRAHRDSSGQLASVGVGGGPWDQAAYHRLSRRWEFWGVVALLAPLAALVLMIYKLGS